MVITLKGIAPILTICLILFSSCKTPIPKGDENISELFELYLISEDPDLQAKAAEIIDDSLVKYRNTANYFNPILRLRESVDFEKDKNTYEVEFTSSEDSEYKINKRNILEFHLTKTDEIIFENDTIKCIAELMNEFKLFFSNPDNSPLLPEKELHLTAANDTVYIVKQGIFINTSICKDSTNVRASWPKLKNMLVEIIAQYSMARDSISAVVYDHHYDDLNPTRKEEILGFFPTRVNIYLNRDYDFKFPVPPPINMDSIIDADLSKENAILIEEILQE